MPKRLRQALSRLRRSLRPLLNHPVISVPSSRIIGIGLLLDNAVSRIGNARQTPFVCSFPSFDVAQSLDYLNEVFEDYFAYTGIDQSEVVGKSILEVGPGENLGVGIRFLAAGAARVVSVDRFRSLRPDAEQLQLYRTLLQGLPSLQRERVEEVVTLGEGGIRIDPARYAYLTDTPVESLSDHLAPGTFDMIVSRAVLEHILDMDKALSAMDHLLKPGGVMIHEVDLRDHGLFMRYGLHPLTFLTFGRRSWYAMSSHKGYPNRVPLRYYTDELRRRGYDCETLSVHVMTFREEEIKVHKKMLEYGSDYDDKALRLIRDIRPWLDRTFAALPDDELLVGAFLLTARKRDSI